MNKLADRVDALVADNRQNLDESIANIKDLSAKLRISADNLNQISGKIARGEGTIGKLVNDETTVDNLNAEPEVRRERRAEPQEHDRPSRAVAPRHQPPRRRRCRG